MNFNQVHFSETYQGINEEIERLKDIQEDTLQLLIYFLMSCDRVNQKSIEHKPFFQLLAKIRFNLEAIQLLMPSLTDDFRFKTSLNILYRGLVSDLITTLYLLTWCDLTRDEQPLLAVELDILQVDFLKAIDRIVIAENELSPLELDRNEQWRQEVIAENLDLYNSTNKSWKTAKQIRMRTGYEYSINPNLANPTETVKISHIGESKLASKGQLESCFRYLSQFQHFSPRMHDFLLSDPAYDLEVYQNVLHTLLLTMDYLSKVLNYNKKEDFKIQFDFVIDKFNSAYPPPQVPPSK